MSESIIQLNDKLRGSLAFLDIEIKGIEDLDKDILTDCLLLAEQISSQQANTILEEASGLPAIDPRLISYSANFIEHMKLLIPVSVMHEKKVFPIKHTENLVHLVMVDPFNKTTEGLIEAWTGSRIERYCCHSTALSEALEKYFPLEEEKQAESPEIIIESAVKAINKIRNDQSKTLWDLINHSRVIQLLRLILTEAVENNASDIHFEPQKDYFRIRTRLDGVLHTSYRLDSSAKEGLIARIKMIAGMQLDVTKTPQDGRIDYHVVANNEIDIRCSILPTIYGEKAVLRILDKGKKRVRFTDFNIDATERALLEHAIHRPNGLLLVTGPTGSGKTTTLYAFLDVLNQEDVNISTAEDPVEYELDGIIQVPCDAERGVSFAGALRSFLRQDPDIIMVGEIRDLETADIAVKAALTGHVVFSTLHTNDAPGTITRIINLGVPAFLLSSCGLTVVAQRLVRTLCPHCKEEYIPEKSTLSALSLRADQMTYYYGKGCEECSGTGYKGRVSIMEILVVNDEIERLILEQRPVGEIKTAAVKNGMVTLREDALKRLAQEITSPDEILRVTLDA